MREIILRLLRAELRRSRTVSATLLVLIAISAALSGTGMALVSTKIGRASCRERV